VEKDLSEFVVCRENPNWVMNTCKDCKRIKDNEYSRKRNTKDRNKVIARNKKWAEENREYDLERRCEYNREHRQEVYESQKVCRLNKIEQYRKTARDNVRERRHNDLDFRLSCILRGRVVSALRGRSKSVRTMEMVGCLIEELKNHLQSKFTEGMNWVNYGKDGWHIDHIIPCASFDLSKMEEQRKCFHFSNLQPLWAVDNIRKGARLTKAA
jgi:hypothetical protein